MNEIKKGNCSYCSRKNVNVKSTPFMADIQTGAMMCDRCWRLTRDSGRKKEEIDIGPFYDEQEYDDGGD